jgi:hypothetical protein
MQHSLFKDQRGQFSYAIYFIVVMVMFLPILLIGFPTLQRVMIEFEEFGPG